MNEKITINKVIDSKIYFCKIITEASESFLQDKVQSLPQNYILALFYFLKIELSLLSQFKMNNFKSPSNFKIEPFKKIFEKYSEYMEKSINNIMDEGSRSLLVYLFYINRVLETNYYEIRNLQKDYPKKLNDTLNLVFNDILSLMRNKKVYLLLCQILFIKRMKLVVEEIQSQMKNLKEAQFSIELEVNSIISKINSEIVALDKCLLAIENIDIILNKRRPSKNKIKKLQDHIETYVIQDVLEVEICKT